MSTLSDLEYRSVASLLNRAEPIDVPPEQQRVFENLQRTEDCRFSPDGTRLAVAGYAKAAIVILELSPPPLFKVIGSLELTHPGLNLPHGLDWLDETHLVVGNRDGFIQIFQVPPAAPGERTEPAKEVLCIDRVSRWRNVKNPGSLGVVKREGKSGTYDLWACNNYVHRITHHTIERTEAGLSCTQSQVAMTKDLRTPDGISISDDARFAAISNHQTHQVFLCAIQPNKTIHRIGKLHNIDYPHGLRFLPEGKTLLVADAGQPFLQVFETNDDWQGDHYPTRSVRVMEDATYLKARINPMEGGIKGIDLDLERGLVATTCELQTLEMFRLSDVLGTDANDLSKTA